MTLIKKLLCSAIYSSSTYHDCSLQVIFMNTHEVLEMNQTFRRSRGSSVSIVTRYRTTGVRLPEGEEIFLFAILSRPALGPTQPSIQWYRGYFFLW